MVNFCATTMLIWHEELARESTETIQRASILKHRRQVRPNRLKSELPVPIFEQSDDSIRLRFATSRRTAKRYRPAAHFSGALVAGNEPHPTRNPCAAASLAT